MRWEELSMSDRSNLMKTYLQNGVTQLSAMRDHYNKFVSGGPLRDEYDNPDQYYDYRTVEEVGDMYDPKSKHWASRDPRTGMILKNPKHPTFGMAIREDKADGYSLYIDSSTGRYYTLRPEEYAISPYKPTLHRVNNFDGGGYTDLPVRDSTQPILRPILAGNFQAQEQPEYIGPIVGEIRADERSKTQKFFDKIRTKYNSSSFGNNAVAEVLSATTPYGLVHEGMQGNSGSALLSIAPVGAVLKEGKAAANVARSTYKGSLSNRADNIFKNLGDQKELEIKRLILQPSQGKVKASDLKYQQDRLNLFKEYLNDPEVRKKIPSIYESRIDKFMEDLDNMQKVYSNDLNNYYDIIDAPYFLGYNTKVANPPNPRWAGWYDLTDDLIRLTPSSIKEKNNFVWPHEYNHFLDHDIVSKAGYRTYSPEMQEYLNSLIEPYRYSSRKEYFVNTQLRPISKYFYKLSHTNLGKKISKVVPTEFKDWSRKTYQKFYRNSADNINNFSYYTSPMEVREFMSQAAQDLWRLNKEVSQNRLTLSNSEKLIRQDPNINVLLEGIPRRNLRAFLKNFEEKGFSSGGYL